jgi:hypothetical protein
MTSAAPGATAVTTPLAETVAVAGALERQATAREAGHGSGRGTHRAGRG